MRSLHRTGDGGWESLARGDSFGRHDTRFVLRRRPRSRDWTNGHDHRCHREPIEPERTEHCNDQAPGHENQLTDALCLSDPRQEQSNGYRQDNQVRQGFMNVSKHE